MIPLRHGHLDLVLHKVQEGTGTPLLVLHELGGSASTASDHVDEFAWPGAIYALDFSGHGHSSRPRGGAYLPEYWVGDADAALEAIGPAAVLGAGLGAYIAMLLAGARPESVLAAGLLPGNGLDGAGSEPHFDRSAYATFVAPTLPKYRNGADSRVAISEGTIRPPYYVVPIACEARALVLESSDRDPPAWWFAVAELPRSVVVAGGTNAVLGKLRELVGRSE